ncbi:hypothetical protein BKA67DRAFT_540009 [Truncatella angustata]|uniref:Hydantoinase/oxoprolinase n=1 Tax=Truncatella angustata TaxID=152316 RepID=A0A9P8ZUQ3_9PEZI|nr:uncharacterized protein BKA67DRAFT_540009 [Truncatella angustata]KAH6648199.1 hypothetical protein BKA67DRAFT_540009 [Truncatella angustata]
MSMYRIGLDVGGTNTDAAILDITASDTPGRCVLAPYKTANTTDITSSIEDSIHAILAESRVEQGRVLSATIGITHFINALVEADSRRLDRVAVVRLCGPFARQIPPFPISLSVYEESWTEGHTISIAGVKCSDIYETTHTIVGLGITSVAIVGIFSPLDHRGLQGKACKQLMTSKAPKFKVVCSHDTSRTRFVERENAMILNATILKTSTQVTRGFRRAMARLGLHYPLFLSQNDGTIIDADTAARISVKIFAYIGSTTIGACARLPSGFPRQAPGFVEVGGVQTAFSMPEVVSIGLGGGSIVQASGGASGGVNVGPGSVGHRIHEEAMVFGGSTVTSTDIVVAMGKACIGDATLVKYLTPNIVNSAHQEIKRMLENATDQMKVSSAPVHVLLVSGEVDSIELPEGHDERAIVVVAQQRAIEETIAKGALRDDVRIVEIIQTSLQDMDNGAMKLQVRAVGSLAIPESRSGILGTGGRRRCNGKGLLKNVSCLSTFSVYGYSLTPCVLSDARGNVSVVMNIDTPTRLEKILRKTATELGLGYAVCAKEEV